MRTLLALSLTLAALACQKAESPSSPPATEPTAAAPAVAKPADTAPAAARPAQPTEAAAAPAEGSCAGEMAEGGSCAGGCNQWDQAANDVLKRELPADAQWTTLAVEGMTCGGCERRIIANVGQVEGVLKVEADAESGQVRLAMADTGTVEAAKSRIRELGYRVAE